MRARLLLDQFFIRACHFRAPELQLHLGLYTAHFRRARKTVNHKELRARIYHACLVLGQANPANWSGTKRDQDRAAQLDPFCGSPLWGLRFRRDRPGRRPENNKGAQSSYCAF